MYGNVCIKPAEISRLITVTQLIIKEKFQIKKLQIDET